MQSLLLTFSLVSLTSESEKKNVFIRINYHIISDLQKAHSSL